MGIKRDLMEMFVIVHKQGCKIKRWKLTDAQAHALAPTMQSYERMVRGTEKFFDIPIKVKHDRRA